MLIISIFILLSVLSYNDKSKQRDVAIVFFVLCVLSIIFVYRASDFPFYKSFFEKIEPLYKVILGENSNFLNKKDHLEIGYKVLNSFIRIFTDKVELLFYLINGFVIVIIYFFTYGKSKNSFKLIIPYFIFLYISIQAGIARQMLAICVFFISIRYILNRDLIKFLICTVIAMSFHRSAVIMPVFYVLADRDYSIKLMIILYIIGMLIFLEVVPFNTIQIVEWINRQIPFEMVNTKINFYVWQTQNLEIPPKLNRGIFENSLIFFLVIYIKQSLSERKLYDKFTNVALNLSLIYIYIYIYFFDISSFSYRLNYYLIFFKFFVIIKFIENLEIKTNRIIGNSLLLVYCAIMMIIRIDQGY